MTAARETFRARSRAEGDPGRRCSWRLLARTAPPDTPAPAPTAAPDRYRSGAWPYAVVAALCAAAVLGAAAITGPDATPAPPAPAPAAEDALGGMTSGGTR